MSSNKEAKKDSYLYIKLENGKTIKIRSIDNYFDPLPIYAMDLYTIGRILKPYSEIGIVYTGAHHLAGWPRSTYPGINKLLTDKFNFKGYNTLDDQYNGDEEALDAAGPGVSPDLFLRALRKFPPDVLDTLVVGD